MNELSSTLEDYLEAILLLQYEKEVARVKDLAKIMKVKPSSVTAAISRLVAANYAEHEKYGYIRLTANGKRIAKKVYSKHEILVQFLNDLLGIDENTAIPQACNIEHYIGKNTKYRLIQLLKFFKENPDIEKLWRDYLVKNNKQS